MIRLKKTRWRKADLDRKRVQFVDLPSKGQLISSIGKFSALGSESDVSILVHYEVRGSSKDATVVKIFPLTEQMEQKIVRHPDPNVADFLLK